MSVRNDSRVFGLYWIPFILGLGTACLYIALLIKRWHRLPPEQAVILVAGVIVGVFSVILAMRAAAGAKALADARERELTLEERLAAAHHQSRELVSHLEVLTAMREMTRILSDAVDLKQIAASVFDVLAPLLGSSEIALFLHGDRGHLVLKALHREGKTAHDTELKGDEVEMADAQDALAHQRTVKTVGEKSGSFCVPLIADQNPIGVMRFVIPLDGDEAQRDTRVRELETTLADIAKHLALVVKTPRLHDQAIIDSLTGLFTRHHFDIRIDDMFRVARRYGKPFALILLDIDRFKQVNDTYGHRAGDAALREVAALITTGIRDCDSAFRYGGEEFAILLPETTAEQALNIAERLRNFIKGHKFVIEQDTLSLTISQGVAEYGPDLANQGELIGLADRALYESKHAGRDSVNIALNE